MENTNETKKQEIEKVKTTNETNYIWRKLVETKRYDILDLIKIAIRKLLNTNKRIKLALIINKEGDVYLKQILDEQKLPKTDDELIIDIFSTGEFSIMDHIKKYDNKEIENYLSKNNLLEAYEAYKNSQPQFNDQTLQFYYFVDQLNGSEREKLRNALITDLIYDYINNYEIIPYY